MRALGLERSRASRRCIRGAAIGRRGDGIDRDTPVPCRGTSALPSPGFCGDCNRFENRVPGRPS